MGHILPKYYAAPDSILWRFDRLNVYLSTAYNLSIDTPVSKPYKQQNNESTT